MDWARDTLNQLISADQYSGERPIFCPTCNGLVHHRPGIINRPHFAHNKACSAATHECENYHPSDAIVSTHNKNSRRNPLKNKLHSLNVGGNFFAFSPLNGGSLVWQLPHIGHCLSQNYEVDFHTKKGIQTTVLGPQSKVPQIQLLPQIPLAAITVQNTTDESKFMISFLEQLLCTFSNEFNFFKINENSSRLLTGHQDLEYGCHYWILVPKKLPPLPDPLQCLISSSEEWQGWYIYCFNLEIGHTPLLTVLALEYFGKNITETQPTLSFISPLPHHIDDDGIYIFDTANPILHLKIKNKTANFDIEILNMDGRVDGVAYVENDYAVIDTRLLAAQNLDIFINKYAKCTIRSEECPLFAPTGIMALSSDKYLELFDCQLHIAHSHNEALNTTIKLPDCSIKNFLLSSVPNEIILSDDIDTITVKTQEGIDGRNFGYIPSIQHASSCDASLSGDTPPINEKYLMNLLSTIITPECCIMIQKAHDPQKNLARLASQNQLPAWVMSYINLGQ